MILLLAAFSLLSTVLTAVVGLYALRWAYRFITKPETAPQSSPLAALSPDPGPSAPTAYVTPQPLTEKASFQPPVHSDFTEEVTAGTPYQAASSIHPSPMAVQWVEAPDRPGWGDYWSLVGAGIRGNIDRRLPPLTRRGAALLGVIVASTCMFGCIPATIILLVKGFDKVQIAICFLLVMVTGVLVVCSLWIKQSRWAASLIFLWMSCATISQIFVSKHRFMIPVTGILWMATVVLLRSAFRLSRPDDAPPLPGARAPDPFLEKVILAAAGLAAATCIAMMGMAIGDAILNPASLTPAAAQVATNPVDSARQILGAVPAAKASQATASLSSRDWDAFLNAKDSAYGQYPADPYAGPIVPPTFKGAQANYTSFRTDLTEGAREGANYAGSLALVQTGCGTGCSVNFLIDVSTGQISDFPLGGEENLYLSLNYRKSSRLLRAVWNTTEGDKGFCIAQSYVWNGNELKEIGPRLRTASDAASPCPNFTGVDLLAD